MCFVDAVIKLFSIWGLVAAEDLFQFVFGVCALFA